jgi:hypothetical protein
MKRLAGALVLAALAIVVSAAIGSPGRVATKCGGKMSILVWPHGHDVIPSVNFPAIVNPHVEVYVGWNQKYPEALYGGYVVGGKPKGAIPVGDVNLHLNCINYGNTAKATATVPGGVKVSAQTALRCTCGIRRLDLIERGRGVASRSAQRPERPARRHVPSIASVTVPKGVCPPADEVGDPAGAIDAFGG